MNPIKREMRKIGFQLVDTGGNCTAYKKVLSTTIKSNSYLLITLDDAIAPSNFEDEIRLSFIFDSDYLPEMTQTTTLREFIDIFKHVSFSHSSFYIELPSKFIERVPDTENRNLLTYVKERLVK